MYRLYPNFLASRIAEKVVANSQNLMKQRDEIRYGLEWIISLFNQVAIIAIIGLSLNMLYESLTVLATGAILRMFSGGAHLKGYFSCLIFSTLQISIFALLAKYFTNSVSNFEKIFLFAVFLALIFTALKAPVLNKKKAQFNAQQKLKLKYISIIVFMLLFIISYFLLHNLSYMYCIWFALLMQTFSLSQSATRLYAAIGHLYSLKGGEPK